MRPTSSQANRCEARVATTHTPLRFEVEIDYAPGHLHILVRDDGCGMESGLLERGSREEQLGPDGRMREQEQKRSVQNWRC